MVTLDQVVERVLAAIPNDAQRPELVRLAVRATIKELGLFVAEATGEVYSPEPKPVINFPYDDAGYRGRRRR